MYSWVNSCLLSVAWNPIKTTPYTNPWEQTQAPSVLQGLQFISHIYVVSSWWTCEWCTTMYGKIRRCGARTTCSHAHAKLWLNRGGGGGGTRRRRRRVLVSSSIPAPFTYFPAWVSSIGTSAGTARRRPQLPITPTVNSRLLDSSLAEATSLSDFTQTSSVLTSLFPIPTFYTR